MFDLRCASFRRKRNGSSWRRQLGAGRVCIGLRVRKSLSRTESPKMPRDHPGIGKMPIDSATRPELSSNCCCLITTLRHSRTSTPTATLPQKGSCLDTHFLAFLSRPLSLAGDGAMEKMAFSPGLASLPLASLDRETSSIMKDLATRSIASSYPLGRVQVQTVRAF